MKTERFFFAMVGCGALALGLSCAGEPSSQPSQRAVLKKPASAANGGSMMGKTGNHYEQPARLPVGSGTTAPRPGVVRSRSATAALLGGATGPGAKHAAAVIDGAAIRRKP